MRMTIFSDCRCALDGDGRFRTVDGLHPYSFWCRYLDVFDEVTVVSRFSAAHTEGPVFTGPHVSFVAVPDFRGVREYARNVGLIRRIIARTCQEPSAFLLQMPGRVAGDAARQLRRVGKSYGVELAGDPTDVFAPGAIKHPLRPLIRHLLSSDVRSATEHAGAALYVTSAALQRAYPCRGMQISASDVELNGSALADDFRHAQSSQTSFRIITVATLARLYKGTDVLLDALATCVSRGLDITLVVVGDGRFRAQLEAQARALGLDRRVTFRGQLPAGAAVRAELDAADLFVLPSRADAMPRALIEAMARGLPCIGSRVGGIPELLPEADLVTPGNPDELARLIETVLTAPHRRDEMAARALARARCFNASLLRERRQYFYRAVLSLYEP